MTRLSCCVNSCSHNKQNCCCKDTIKVGGREANMSSSTSCESFLEENGSFMNSMESPKSNLDVQCEATNCTHNCNRHCDASYIDINGVSACDCKETECNSFVKK